MYMGESFVAYCLYNRLAGETEPLDVTWLDIDLSSPTMLPATIMARSTSKIRDIFIWILCFKIKR